jgi:hypothetical protein
MRASLSQRKPLKRYSGNGTVRRRSRRRQQSSSGLCSPLRSRPWRLDPRGGVPIRSHLVPAEGLISLLQGSPRCWTRDALCIEASKKKATSKDSSFLQANGAGP